MSGAHERGPREPSRRPQLWRGFRRARLALWLLLALLVVAGAGLHDSMAHSLFMRLLWLVAVAALIGYPLRYLFGFRCPRCGGVYLATGGLRDFLGLGRILWANRCGSCSLPAGHAGPPSAGELPESRPSN